MPAVAGVVAVVASVVSAVSYAIAGITTVFTISSIVAAVASAVATIGTVIKYGLKGSITQIASAVLGIARTFVVALKGVETALARQFLYKATFAPGLVAPYISPEAQRWLEAWRAVTSITAAVEEVIQTPIKFIEQSIDYVVRQINAHVELPRIDFDQVNVRLSEALKIGRAHV